ncbi:MAG: hypothetical protein MJZ34_03190 [Paludibacteraceae bacterium]|nr:hypothetical protein [Paludibacteraceae bacterium]
MKKPPFNAIPFGIKHDKTNMKVLDYLNNLLNFYTELTKYPLSKLTYFAPNNLVEIHFQDQTVSMNHCFGFEIKKTCYVSGKLALKNVLALEKYLQSDFDDYMVTVKINKNSCEVYAYDVFGRVLSSDKIKFTTLNLFS